MRCGPAPLNVPAKKFHDWQERYGKVNQHNGWVPRDFWLEDWEKQAIIGFHVDTRRNGFRIENTLLVPGPESADYMVNAVPHGTVSLQWMHGFPAGTPARLSIT